jgi:starvation-inducible DNA-binding protein
MIDRNRGCEIFIGEVHGVVEEYQYVATASLIENWADETERRVWFIFESARG